MFTEFNSARPLLGDSIIIFFDYELVFNLKLEMPLFIVKCND